MDVHFVLFFHEKAENKKMCKENMKPFESACAYIVISDVAFDRMKDRPHYFLTGPI